MVHEDKVEQVVRAGLMDMADRTKSRIVDTVAQKNLRFLC
jgi:hypothetical protein